MSPLESRQLEEVHEEARRVGLVLVAQSARRYMLVRVRGYHDYNPEGDTLAPYACLSGSVEAKGLTLDEARDHVRNAVRRLREGGD